MNNPDFYETATPEAVMTAMAALKTATDALANARSLTCFTTAGSREIIRVASDLHSFREGLWKSINKKENKA